MGPSLISTLFFIALLPQSLCIWLYPDDLDSLKYVTGIIADGLMDYYTGEDYGQVVGMFANPYYWWQAGGAWGSMIDFWYFMENDTYLNTTMNALQAQVGDNWDYVPINQSTTEGNDDQGFWGLAVMSAAERGFPNPPEDRPGWLYLAQAVFNTMSARWDPEHCGGGLRWQIFEWNSGYDYKNAVSNGCLFNIGARLARYTGNATYAEIAEKVHDWMYDVGLIHESDWYFVFDGANIGENCTDIVQLQWTYNQGLMMSGSAYMYNFTQEEKWKNRTLRYLQSSSVFFNNSVMMEAACQSVNNCNNDQRSFKAYFSRFLGQTAQMVPEAYDTVYQYLDASARGASNSCSGGRDGNTCGLNWFYEGWDGYYGLGEQMSALEVMQNLRIRDRPPALTAMTGGFAVGDPAAGTQEGSTNLSPLDIDDGEVVGAAIITVIIALSIIATGLWVMI